MTLLPEDASLAPPPDSPDLAASAPSGRDVVRPESSTLRALRIADAEAALRAQADGMVAGAEAIGDPIAEADELAEAYEMAEELAGGFGALALPLIDPDARPGRPREPLVRRLARLVRRIRVPRRPALRVLVLRATRPPERDPVYGLLHQGYDGVALSETGALVALSGVRTDAPGALQVLPLNRAVIGEATGAYPLGCHVLVDETGPCVLAPIAREVPFPDFQAMAITTTEVRQALGETREELGRRADHLADHLAGHLAERLAAQRRAAHAVKGRASGRVS